MDSRGRNYVTCGNCRTMYDASGRNPRCPSCNERYEEHEALPPLPPMAGRFSHLEDPHFETDPNARDDEVAPLSEFIAAFVILGAFVLMIAGVFVRSPLMLTSGLIVMGVAAIIFGVAKLRSMFSRRNDAGESMPGIADYLFGRRYWGGAQERRDEPPARRPTNARPRNDADRRRGR